MFVINVLRRVLKMPKCPKCKEEIGTLSWSENAVRFGTYNGGTKFGMDYEVDSVESAGNDEFMCPECDEVLFTDKKKAEEFLK